MSSIDPTSALAAYLRGQLGQLSPTSRSTRLGTEQAGSRATRAANAGAPSDGLAPAGRRGQERPADLAATVARRVAAIDRNDPDRRRKAFRVFLESVLLDEWGDQLINDPGFQQLVDGVQNQMEQDEQLALLMGQAADRMLAPVPR